MHNWGLWLRWSWRDLRENWLLVTVIALIIALGTGVYTGLGSTTPWRFEATDQSYELLNMYDLRIELTEGSFVDQGALLDVIAALEHTDWIEDAEERLITPTNVQTEANSETILVRGRLIGVDVTGDGPHINGVFAERGRAFTAADAGQPVSMIEYNFATYYDLPDQGQITLGGETEINYIGQGLAPEYFTVLTRTGGIWAQASFAAVFVPLATAQSLSDHANQVNDVLLTLVDNADRDVVQAEVDAALRAAFPRSGFSLLTPEEDPAYDLTNKSPQMNQQVFDIIAILFLAGAMLGAFNLASRLVEAQRRQIGIGMALGVAPRWLAVRPMLVGLQIAILGAIFGIVMGLGMGKLAAIWMDSLIPMPVDGRLFHASVFMQGAALGLVLPVLATLIPVWRAVRVMPVDAIRTGHLIAKSGRLTAIGNKLPLPGNSFVQMPIRNLLRSPRRTLLTVLGIATAISTLVGMVGMGDTAHENLDTVRNEAFQDHPDRQIVILNHFYTLDSDPVTGVMDLPSVELAAPGIQVGGEARRGDMAFAVIVNVLDLENLVWTPTIVQGDLNRTTQYPGVVISKTAAHDLNAGIGDTFTLQHPYRAGLFEYELRETEVEIVGFHADPWRFPVYMDSAGADMMGLSGLVNVVHVTPVPQTGKHTLRQQLSGTPGVASVSLVSDMVQSLEMVMQEVIRFLSGVEIAVIALAVLIAFNSTNINISERARDIATMFAFGLPVRTAVRMIMLENGITGVLGTLIGIVAGRATVTWFYAERMPIILPDMRFDITLSGRTLIMAVVIGVIVVALTPLLSARRMAAMDIPSTLRIME